MKKRTKQAGSDIAVETVPPASGDRQFVTALQRGLDILRAFRPADTALGNQELAERSGLPNSTVSRLTYTLSKLGYLVYLEETGKYRMGVPVLGLGYACLSGLKVREVAQPYLDALAEHAGNGILVAMGGRDEFSMIYVACARSPGVVSLQLNVGSRISLARSSMGRAYLAAAPARERETLLRGIEARTDKARWPRLHEEILRAIEEIETRGFCLNSGEWHADVNSVGVPLVPLHGGGPVLALNCGGPAYLLPRERLENDLGPRMAEMVKKIRYSG
ncbi:IclR family transcriptional regulator [Aquamicrobium defluvii]|uniref:IclR family transcriptional regulator n=1 Tax=Aquamicrobium defluvii TaxID=69279 RepID=A0A011U270_9HYPH|nr:IclR family transcriptional regulator [Aquamicrobium defluvii]EXL10532.1 IclR family transcriptional regulator [Aquamicrobium defluvii]EZQ17709.1 IclR family transcriptional regulator [Halopseudomonas bauzanensis]TDR37337.1 IclR family transcriptional regulator [Aquamicrobium defluvii]